MRTIKLTYPDGVPMEEISPEFYQMQINRMAVGFYRYGPLSKNWRPAYKRALDMVRRYLRTGNREFLLDAANYLMSEFKHPKHPKSHMKILDQGAAQPAIQYFRDMQKGG